MTTYKIVRSYFSAGIRKRTIATGLTPAGSAGRVTR